jgi:hypothetical protein
MNTPADHNESLHELELNVGTDLTRAETGPGHQEADAMAVSDSLIAEDEQRYEVSLRVLLGAVQAMEDDSRPDPRPAQA